MTYAESMDRVRRESETEAIVRAKDTPELVDWLLDLEDLVVDVIRWRALDGDGISDPLRGRLYDALWTAVANHRANRS